MAEVAELKVTTYSRRGRNDNLKLRLIYRDGNKCCYCQKEFNDPATIDHMTPLCKGGSNKIDNLVLSCNKCNNIKGDLLPLEFFFLDQNKPKSSQKNAMNINNNSNLLWRSYTTYKLHIG